MAHPVVFVLDNLDQCPSILEAWDESGVPGVTILESTGLRLLRGVLRDDMPLFPSLRDVLASRDLHHRTGLLFAVPVTRVLGLGRQDLEEP